ncbi:MAG: hypothetical protein ACJAR0_001420 [Candidatus Azotimanducaceae bacterium]
MLSSDQTRSRVRGMVNTANPENLPEAGFENMDQAGLHALLQYNTDSIAANREYVGGVLKCEDCRYIYTHGHGRRHQAPVQFSFSQTKQCRIAALWHTHGTAGHHKSMFSPSDTHSANQIDKPIYMADHTGTIRVYEPGSAAGVVVFESTLVAATGR